MPTVAADQALQFCNECFSAAGLSDEDAAILAGSVVDANLAGHDSHGLMLVPRYARGLADGSVPRVCKLEFERRTANSARIHAHDSQGHVAGRKITELAIEQAREHGMAAVTAHHLGHVGRLGAYVEMAAQNQCIALATVNNHGGATWMAPFGGTDRRLSPNPLAIGAPTRRGFPLMLDMSCSVVAAGKCLVQESRGRRVPIGWILDSQGNPTTDASALIGPPAGALLPLGGEIGGHKGYALGFMMDVLAGALSSAGCSTRHDFIFQNGFFLTVIRIENFVDPAEFIAEVDRLIDWVKSSPPRDPDREILVPGEFEARTRTERSAAGIPLPHRLAEKLAETAAELGIAYTLQA